MLKILGKALAILWCVTGFASLNYGATITFSGSLIGANENPVVTSPATGFSTVSLDTVTQLLTIDVTFDGLTTPTTAAHIHCCVSAPGNVGVATTVPAFTGFPLGVTSGTFHGVLDLTDAASYNPTFVSMNGGTVASAEAVFVTGFENGMTYLNVHTMQNPGGEVRTFLTTPEPGSLALLCSGLLGLFLVWRKRPSCLHSL